eukprot:COSAG01_NODE_4659_length_4842_cov_92.367489_1_plen_216_part_00
MPHAGLLPRGAAGSGCGRGAQPRRRCAVLLGQIACVVPSAAPPRSRPAGADDGCFKAIMGAEWARRLSTLGPPPTLCTSLLGEPDLTDLAGWARCCVRSGPGARRGPRRAHVERLPREHRQAAWPAWCRAEPVTILRLRQRQRNQRTSQRQLGPSGLLAHSEPAQLTEQRAPDSWYACQQLQATRPRRLATQLARPTLASRRRWRWSSAASQTTC